MRRFACLLLFIAAPAFAQEESWVGKTVLTKQFGIGINRIDNQSKENYPVSVLEKTQADLRWVGDELVRQRLELFQKKKVYRQE